MSKMQTVGILASALRRPASYAGHAREVLAAAQCAALYPLGVIEKALSTGQPTGDRTYDTPVVLVHGYGHNWSGWIGLERALRRAGFTSVHTMNYIAFGTEGVPALAARLAARVDAVKRLTGAPRVHVVGHSLGGVLMRWYVQELGGDDHVDTAITVASPHEGSIAAIAAPGPAARDLRPGSRVMRRLAIGTRPSAVHWVALYSNLDMLVRPESARLRAPALAAENVFVKDHGHLSIMLSPVVTDAIVSRLADAARPLAPVLPLRINRPRSPQRHPGLQAEPQASPTTRPVRHQRAG